MQNLPCFYSAAASAIAEHVGHVLLWGGLHPGAVDRRIGESPSPVAAQPFCTRAPLEKENETTMARTFLAKKYSFRRLERPTADQPQPPRRKDARSPDCSNRTGGMSSCAIKTKQSRRSGSSSATARRNAFAQHRVFAEVCHAKEEMLFARSSI